MKNPLSDSSSLSTPGLLLGKTARREESTSEMVTEKKVSESRVDSGTFTMRSAERKGLIDEGRWLSLDRRGKTSRQNTPADIMQGEQEGRPDSRPDSNTETLRPKSPSRSKSRERSPSPGGEGDVKKVKSFWVDLDNDTQRKQSQERA